MSNLTVLDVNKNDGLEMVSTISEISVMFENLGLRLLGLSSALSLLTETDKLPVAAGNAIGF